MLLLEEEFENDTAMHDIVRDAENLGMFPEIAQEIQALTRENGASAGDLERVVSKDMALTARLLRLANSPYYGGRRTVTTLRHALVVLGFHDASQIALAFAMTSIALQSEASRRVMLRSARTAVIARELARHTRALEPSEAFVAGMLHDLGEVVLLERLGDAYAAVACDPVLTGHERLVSERAVSGTDHAEVGEECLKKWRFSCSTTLSVRHHPRPLQHAGFDGRPAFCGDSLVAMADWVEAQFATHEPKDDIATGMLHHPLNDTLEISEERAAAAVAAIELELTALD